MSLNSVVVELRSMVNERIAKALKQSPVGLCLKRDEAELFMSAAVMRQRLVNKHHGENS